MLSPSGRTVAPTMTPPAGLRRALAAFLIVAAALTLFISQLGPLDDYDLWWDLRLGQQIVETHHVPHETLYINNLETFRRAYWADDEWGFCVLVYSIWRAAGFAGLAVLKAALITAIFLVLFFGCRGAAAAGPAPLPLVPALALMWLATQVMSSRFALRPQLVTDLVLALLTLILLRRERAPAEGVMWGVAPLFVLWANLHAGVVGGLTLLLMWTVGVGLSDGVKAARPLAASFLLGCGGALLTPAHWHMIEHVFVTLSQRPAQYIVEWAPLDPSKLVGPIGVFMALEVVALAIDVRRRSFRLSHALVMAGFTFLTWRQNRALGELTATATLLIAWTFRQHALPWKEGRFDDAVNLLAGIGLAVTLAWTARNPVHLTYAPPRDVFPFEAAEYLETHAVKGNVFNSYHFGDWLVWRGIPPFIHGTHPNYADDLFDRFLDVLGDDAQRAQLLDRYQIRACILAWPIGRDTHLAMIKWLSRQPDWHLVAWDAAALLYVRGEPPTAAYTAVSPALFAPFLTSDLRRVRDDIRRALLAAPGDAAARRMLAEVYIRERRFDMAERLCNELLADNPGDVEIWIKRGVVRYREGRLQPAVDDLRRAVEVRPVSPVARYDLALALVASARAAQASGNTAQANALVNEARTSLREAVRLDPDFEPASRLLGELGG